MEAGRIDWGGPRHEVLQLGDRLVSDVITAPRTTEILVLHGMLVMQHAVIMQDVMQDALCGMTYLQVCLS